MTTTCVLPRHIFSDSMLKSVFFIAFLIHYYYYHYKPRKKSCVIMEHTNLGVPRMEWMVRIRHVQRRMRSRHLGANQAVRTRWRRMPGKCRWANSVQRRGIGDTRPARDYVRGVNVYHFFISLAPNGPGGEGGRHARSLAEVACQAGLVFVKIATRGTLAKGPRNRRNLAMRRCVFVQSISEILRLKLSWFHINFSCYTLSII